MTIKQIDKLILLAIKDLSGKDYEAAHVKLARASLSLQQLDGELEVAEKILTGVLE